MARPLSLLPPAPGEVHAARRLHVLELERSLERTLGAGDPRSRGRSVGRYHRAFVESPHATAIVAVEDREARVVGFLLGSLDAPAHRAFVLRKHGARLAGRALARAVHGLVAGGEPARGDGSEPDADPLRAPLGGLDPLMRPPAAGEHERATRTGDLACAVVDGRWRGLGVGAALVRAYETQARRAGLDGLFAAAYGWPETTPFFARLGWRREDVTTGLARAGEERDHTATASAALYARRLSGKPPSGC